MSDALRELTVGIDFNDIDFSKLTRMDRAIDSIERNLQNLGGDLNRLGTRADEAGLEGTRAMNRLGRSADHAGDAMEELGRDATQAGNRTERAARDAAADVDRLGNHADDAMDEMRRGAGQASDAIRELGDRGDRSGDEIRASSDRAADALRDMGNAGERAAGDIVRAGGRADSALDDLGDTASRAGGEAAGGGNKFLGVLGEVVPAGRAAGMASTLFSNPWVLAAAAVVAAVGGIALAIAGMVNDAEKDFDRLQAKLGATNEQMAGIKDTVLDVYKAGFGESIGDVSDGVASLKQNFKDLDNASVTAIAKGAYTLKDLFGPEVKETSKAIKTMTANFQGLSETDALDLVTTGFQKGGDYADDFLDTVNEYSTYFSKLGISADKFVGTLISGGEAGAFNLDKVGDAFKEIGIRAIDGSATTKDAFSKLGFDAGKMGKDFAAGGKTAEHALMGTVAALSFVDDQQERNRLGVELFGTQWEDMGQNVVFSIDGAEKAVEGFNGATERATDVLQDNVGTKWTQITRGFKASIIDAFSGGGGGMDGFLDKILAFMPQVDKAIHTVAEYFTDLFANTGGSAGNFVDGLASTFQGLWELLQVLWENGGKQTLTLVADAFNVVLDVVGFALNLVGDIIKIFVDVLTGDWSKAWTDVQDLFSDVLYGLIDIAGSVLTMLVDWFGGTIDNVLKLFTDFSLVDAGRNMVQGLIDGAKSLAGAAVDMFKGIGNDIIDGVKSFFGIHSPSTVFMEIGQFLIEGLKNGISSMGKGAVDSIKDVASNIWGGVKDFFGIHSPSKLMAEAGAFITEGLKVGIDDSAMRAVNAAADLSEGVGAAVTASPEVAAMIQPGGPQGQPAAQGSPLNGAPEPIGATAQAATTAPTIQVNLGGITVTLPEGGGTKKQAEDFGAMVTAAVNDRLAAIFTQLGIAMP